MTTNKLYIDCLTGLYNEQYFKKIYTKSINGKNKNNLIIIDFEKFKLINDTFGHSVGDTYLIVFSHILKKVFIDSIIFRLHGDEFAILTELTENEISLCFNKCDKLIELAVDTQKIPKIFGYNAGSCQATLDENDTIERADYMMYYAKREKKNYQPFSETIWKRKLFQKQYLSNIDSLIKNEKFSYVERGLFNKKMAQQPIKQISVRDEIGNSILYDNQYDILRNNSKMKDLDLYNLKKILNNVNMINDSIIINIDYTTLISPKILIEYLKNISIEYSDKIKDVVLSINLAGIDSNDYYNIISVINILRELGYKICLAQYDYKLTDEIWLNSKIDYVKFNNMFLKQAMIDPKSDYYLKSKVYLFSNYDKCIPIFLNIDNQTEHDYLSSIDADNILLGGSYYSAEKKLILSKK